MAVLPLSLTGGRAATLGLSPEATTLTVDEGVSSYDLCGRPFVLTREDTTWRRALDGRLLEKRPARDGVRPRVRRIMPASEGAAPVETARLEAEAISRALAGASVEPSLRAEATRRLNLIVSMDAESLAQDARRFGAVYGTVGILPPDQYLALVLQVSEGCSWNACTFCTLFRGRRFRIKGIGEFEGHMRAVRAYFGEAAVLRRRLFLGDANSLCVPHERLLPLMEAAAREFPVVPRNLSPRTRRGWLRAKPRGVLGLYAFVDAWSGHEKAVEEYQAYARLGLRRVYVGLETGDPDLLHWLNKPGSPEDAVHLVSTLHAAGISVGVIVLIGPGGELFFDAHIRKTAEVLTSMRLGPDDLVYFSELVEPAPEYLRLAARDNVIPLGPERRLVQRRDLLSRLEAAGAAAPVSTYDIREFVY